MKQNGIKFNSFTGNILGRSKTVGHNDNKGMTIDMFEDDEKIPSVINSLEIDWNGAEIVSGQQLNTTGEVLSMLKTAYDNSIFTTATSSSVTWGTETTLATIGGNPIKIKLPELPTASATTLGAIKVGTNLSVASDGTLSATDTKYNNASSSAAGLMSKEDKAKLDGIATGANNYSLPPATTNIRGGIKLAGPTMTVTLSPLTTDVPLTGKVYGVHVNTEGQAFVHVPWTDTNTDTKNTAGSTNSTSKLYIIGATSQGANPQTYSNSKVYIKDNALYANDKKVMVEGDASNYELPTASATTLGGIKVGENLSINNGVLSVPEKIMGNTINYTYSCDSEIKSTWFRLGYFGKSSGFISGAHDISFQLTADCAYRSSTMNMVLSTGSTTGIQTPQASIKVLNCSKYTPDGDPVFSAIRLVKEYCTYNNGKDEVGFSGETLGTTYGVPGQITYIDVKFNKSQVENKSITSMHANLTYIYAGLNSIYMYDKFEPISLAHYMSNKVEISGVSDTTKKAYKNIVITHKDLSDLYQADDTTYLEFANENNGIIDGGSIDTSMTSGIKFDPIKASGKPIYSTDDENLELVKSANSVTVKVKNNVTSQKTSSIFANLNDSIFKRIYIKVVPVNNTINFTGISGTTTIAAQGTTTLTANVTTTGDVGNLAYNWEVSGDTGSVTTTTNGNKLSITGKNATTSSKTLTVKVTVSTNASGVSITNATKSTTVTIDKGTITAGKINDVGTIEYNGTADYRLTTTPQSTIFGDSIVSYKWTATGKNNDGTDIMTISTPNASSTSMTANHKDSSQKTVTIKCEVTFKSGETSGATDTLIVKGLSVSYYWYVGQENPANMTSISPIVNDNTSPGWRYLGSDLSVYNSTNKMWAGAIEPTITFSARDVYYIALPNSSAKVYDDTGYGGVLTDAFSTPTTKDINGVKYYIYTFTAGKSKAFNGDIY